MIDQDHVLTLLPQIYDCALSPELWRPFLAKISHALGGATSSFHVQDASGHISFHSVSPVDQYIEDRFRNNDERYTSPTLKPMARLLAAPAGALLIRESVESDQEFRRSALYNDIFRPLGLWHWTFGPLLRDPAGAVIMAFARPPNRPFEGRDLGFIEQLTPHLARAFQIGLRVGTFAVQERAIDQVVNRLPVGIILLDGTGRVLHLNAAAEAIVGTGDGITIARGAILAARSDESARLRGLISSAVAAGQGHGLGSGGVMAVSRPTLARPYSVLVAPLRDAHSRMSFPRPAAAAVFVTNPEQTHCPPEQVLAQLYGLSRRQAALARRLAEGDSLDAAAARLGISRNTARSHLRYIFDKTGTGRQSELARLLFLSPISMNRP
jgi:DNA-binding CsgD family transcriptional regulator/PAS domain-containing protein